MTRQEYAACVQTAETLSWSKTTQLSYNLNVWPMVYMRDLLTNSSSRTLHIASLNNQQPARHYSVLYVVPD